MEVLRVYRGEFAIMATLSTLNAFKTIHLLSSCRKICNLSDSNPMYQLQTTVVGVARWRRFGPTESNLYRIRVRRHQLFSELCHSRERLWLASAWLHSGSQPISVWCWTEPRRRTYLWNMLSTHHNH